MVCFHVYFLSWIPKFSHNQIYCLIRQNRMPSRFLTYPSTNHKVALIPVCEFDSLMSLIH